MSLNILKEHAVYNAKVLYDTVTSSQSNRGQKTKEKVHQLFRIGKMNPGLWLSTCEKNLQKGLSVGDAALMVSFLPLTFPSESNQRWPWQCREKVNPSHNTLRWLDTLYQMNEQTPIFVDVVPELGDWLADIFNYIPRDIWSASARLLGRLYLNSKSLYKYLLSQGYNLDGEVFFFQGVDTKLQELFDFNQTAKGKGSIKFLFANHLDKEDSISRYGDHSHVHRHGFYLMFQVAMVDMYWYSVLFDTRKKKFAPQIEKITDLSCSTVLCTALLELCYFKGVQSQVDMSVLSELKLTKALLVLTLPNSVSSVPHPDWTQHAEQILQKRVLKISPHRQGSTQMVTQMLDVNTRFGVASEEPLYASVESWMCCSGLDVLWGDVSYDLIAMWLKLFQGRGHESMFQRRFNELNEMHPNERRHRFIECAQIFFGTELYAIQTTHQRKMAFFDLWMLCDAFRTFGDGFDSMIVLNGLSTHIFQDIENLDLDLLTFVSTIFPEKKWGRGEHTKILIVLSILLHGRKSKCHVDELKQLIRDGILDSFLILKESESDGLKTLPEGSEQLDFDLYSASPVAIWLLKENAFKGYQTPITAQLMDKFLMMSTESTQRFILFWLLGLYQPNKSFYKIFSKNLYFPFHLFDDAVIYTQVNWYQVCQQLMEYSDSEGLLIEHFKKVTAAQTKAEFLTLTPDAIAPLTTALTNFVELWTHVHSENHEQLNFPNGTVWLPEDMQRLVELWATLMTDNLPTNAQQLSDEEDRVVEFLALLRHVLANMIHKFDLAELDEVIEQFKGAVKLLTTQMDDEAETRVRAFTDLHIDFMYKKVPFELSFIFRTVLQKIQRAIEDTARTEQQYIEWDKEVQSKYISFLQLKGYLSGDVGYWAHVVNKFEPLRVENFVVQSFLENLKSQTKWHDNNFQAGFEVLQKVFDGYPQGLRVPFAVLLASIPEQQKVLGKQYYNVLIAVIDYFESIQVPDLTNNIISQDYFLSLKRSLQKKELHTVVQQVRGLEITGPTPWYKRIVGTLQLPFIAAVLSLTSLLDFGENLLNVFTIGLGLMEFGLAIVGTGIFFGYPYYSKHRDSGVPLWLSVRNLLPTYLTSWGMSIAFAYVWELSSISADTNLPTIQMWGAPLVLMFFFTSIFIAAFKGAFETDT